MDSGPGSSTFADTLKTLRAGSGLARKELATRAGLGYDRLAKWEQGQSRPDHYDVVVQLGDALGLPPGSAERRALFWLAGEWVERPERLEGLPAARCRRVWGRGDLFDEVEGLLRAPAPPQRIVLLAAFGGYGKTEFARHVADRLAATGAFLDVAWLSLKREEFHLTLGLSSDTPPHAISRAEVLRRLAHRLACRTADEVRARLAAEPLLLVLDNLETLPPGEREAVVSDLHRLLGAGPGRALVTSRFDLTAPYVAKPAFGGLSPAASRSLLHEEARHLPRAAALLAADADTLARIHELTLGMPLALHLVIGQCQHYELDRVLANLADARTAGSDDAFYQFLCRAAWRQLGRPARALLAYLCTATRAPQTSAQLLGVGPLGDIRFDARVLQEALGDLLRWFLVERAAHLEVAGAVTYEVHPLTRAFVLGREVREVWEREFGEDQILAAAARQHQALLGRALEPTG